MTRYPLRIDPDGDQFLATFRDIPEAITGAETHDHVLELARDALVTAMEFYLEDQRNVPEPSEPLEGEYLVELPATISIKVSLLNEMLNQRVRPVDLARILDIKPQSVTRILDIRHATKIDQLADAFKALGKKLDFILT